MQFGVVTVMRAEIVPVLVEHDPHTRLAPISPPRVHGRHFEALPLQVRDPQDTRLDGNQQDERVPLAHDR